MPSSKVLLHTLEADSELSGVISFTEAQVGGNNKMQRVGAIVQACPPRFYIAAVILFTPR